MMILIISLFPPNSVRSLNSLVFDYIFNIKNMEFLLQIPGSLKKLQFLVNNGHYFDQLPSILYELMKKHAPTLEDVSITRDRSGWKNELEWKFPVFPALKRFTLCGVIFRNCLFETSPGNFAGIDYNVSFPVLESLKILHISTARINLKFKF